MKEEIKELLKKEEYYNLFETDENGTFIRLIIPINEPYESETNKEELNLIGRKNTELSIDEIVRVKKYSQKLFEKVNNISEELSKKVQDFAKEHNYETAEYLCDWNGFQCFEPIFNEDQPSYIGAPLLILVDENDNIRMSTNEEAMQQIHDTEKLTKEEAINEYTKKFGGFPYFLFMGASDEVIVKAIQEALKTGNAITAEENKNDY